MKKMTFETPYVMEDQVWALVNNEIVKATVVSMNVQFTQTEWDEDNEPPEDEQFESFITSVTVAVRASSHKIKKWQERIAPTKDALILKISRDSS